VLTDHHARPTLKGEEGHHEESLVPEGSDNKLSLIPKFLGAVPGKDLFADGQGEQAKDKRIESGDDKEKDFIFPAPLIHDHSRQEKKLIRHDRYGKKSTISPLRFQIPINKTQMV
jgi:hypothetical protein